MIKDLKTDELEQVSGGFTLGGFDLGGFGGGGFSLSRFADLFPQNGSLSGGGRLSGPPLDIDPPLTSIDITAWVPDFVLTPALETGGKEAGGEAVGAGETGGTASAGTGSAVTPSTGASTNVANTSFPRGFFDTPATQGRAPQVVYHPHNSFRTRFVHR